MRYYLKNAIAFTTIVVVMWMLAATSFAHHLWVQEVDDAYEVCRGIIGKRLDPYNPSCVKQILADTHFGTGLLITRTDEKERVVFTTNEKPALVAVTSKWGDRVNTTRGKKLINRQAAEAAGLTVISAFNSTQFSKTLFDSSGINCQPLGLKFELVPLVDPTTLAPGTPSAFKLLFDGQPLAGTSIFTNIDQEFKTDANGVAKFFFEKTGVQLLYAIHRVPAKKDSGLDYLKFMTFLIFEVKQ